jgi:hypothetical protein
MSQLKHPDQRNRAGGRSGQGMMIVLCAPLLVLAVVLVATGIAGGFLILGTIMCLAMMAMMMWMMAGGGQK